MKLTKKITLALGLLAGSTGIAQIENSSNGLLGQQFAELSFSFIEIDNISKLSHEPGLRINMPLIPSLVDVGGGYSYSRVRGPIKGHANSVHTYAIGYLAVDGVKPFLGASLGYNWTSLPLGLSDKGAEWGLVAGVEIPAGPVTVTPSIGHSDDFKNGFGKDDVWTYRVEGNYWLSRRNAVYAAVAKVDLHNNPVNVWTYEVGVRFRF